MSLKRNKDELYRLQPTISGPEMGRIDDARNSYYRGHLTYLSHVGWVAWVEYDHSTGPGRMRAAITEHPTSRDHALAQLNRRLRDKQFDNSRGSRSGNYTPVGDADTGEITAEILAAQFAFVQRMNDEAA